MTPPAPAAIRVAEPDRERQSRLVLLSLLEDAQIAQKSLQRVNRALQTLSAGTLAVVHSTSEAGLLEAMCGALVKAGYRMAWVGFAEQDAARSVRPVARAGDGAGYVEQLHVTWADEERGRGPVGRCIRTGEAQVAHDIETDPTMAPWRETARQHGYRSVAAFPLGGASGIFGALAIYAGERDAFDTDELSLLASMASELAFGLTTLRLRLAREEDLRRLERSMESTVHTLAGTLEMRDPYTAGHQRRVAAIAGGIGLAMGLTPDRIHGLTLAAAIHDLGKINVPAEILSKPGRLTPLEYEFVKGHAEAGFQLLKAVEFPWPIAEMVRQHHERLDGSGYPRGLKGDEILLEARILAVADVVEAIASHRPYRAAKGLDAGLAKVVQHRGTCFDAAAVDACLELFRKGGFALPD